LFPSHGDIASLKCGKPPAAPPSFPQGFPMPQKNPAAPRQSSAPAPFPARPRPSSYRKASMPIPPQKKHTASAIRPPILPQAALSQGAADRQASPSPDSFSRAADGMQAESPYRSPPYCPISETPFQNPSPFPSESAFPLHASAPHKARAIPLQGFPL